MKHIVEINAHCKITFGNNLATEHIKELELALSQIPRVVEFLRSGENDIWGELWQTGWRWIHPQRGLCWDFLGDYVCVTEV